MQKARNTLGNSLSDIDLKNLNDFIDITLDHYSFQAQLKEYLAQEMQRVAPNLSEILGEQIGAKLLTHTGGLSNLSRLPSSTIQILGAEKALFRALRKKGNTPKFGLLYNSSYIQETEQKYRGRISRMLANKCA